MEQRNLFIAIVLSVGILIGFQFVFQRLHPTVPHVASPTTAPATQSTTPSAAGAPGTAAPGAVAAKAAEPVQAAIAGQGVLLASELLIQQALAQQLLHIALPGKLPGGNYYFVTSREIARREDVQKSKKWLQYEFNIVKQ